MFDVFISHKKTAPDGELTIDFKCAQILERLLEEKGVTVFFSERSLEQEGTTDYKQAIEDAFRDAKILIVMASSLEYVHSRWVSYEWNSYHNAYLSEKRKSLDLFTVKIGGLNAKDLPSPLCDLQVFDFDTEKDKIVNTVLSILQRDKEVKVEEPKPVKYDNPFYLIKPEEITDDDIKEVLAMEAEIYKEDECQDFELCQKINRINPYTDLFFKDLRTGQIVGNIDVCPITDECYELMRSGEFMDSEITIDMVVPYDMPSLYNLYFTGIAVRDEYRNSPLFVTMFNEAVKRFIMLGEEKGVFVKRMIADAVTNNGERFCKIFGMKKILDSEHGSKIYEVSFMPPEFKVSSMQTKRLYEYYKSKYEEMKDFID